jgi:hypothetical protein
MNGRPTRPGYLSNLPATIGVEMKARLRPLDAVVHRPSVDVSLPDTPSPFRTTDCCYSSQAVAESPISCKPSPANVIPPTQTTSQPSSRTIGHKLFDQFDGTVGEACRGTSNAEVTGAPEES